MKRHLTVFLLLLVVCPLLIMPYSSCAELKIKAVFKPKASRILITEPTTTSYGCRYSVYASFKRKELTDSSLFTHSPITVVSGLEDVPTVYFSRLPKLRAKRRSTKRKNLYIRLAELCTVQDTLQISNIAKLKIIQKQGTGVSKKRFLKRLAKKTTIKSNLNFIFHQYYGDIWTATYADDGKVYFIFGDGTGMENCLSTVDGELPGEGIGMPMPATEESPGCFLPDFSQTGEPGPDFELCAVHDCTTCRMLCPYTPAGLVALSGSAPNFKHCPEETGCIVSRNLPYLDETAFLKSDKPSSLISISGRLVAHLHYPPGTVTNGYIAYSDDHGKTWTVVPGSPWDDSSHFKVMMYVQMGKDASKAKDYIYAFGIGDEIDTANPTAQSVYLARVPNSKDDIVDYSKYEYFLGLDSSGNPKWSAPGAHTAAVVAVDTLRTVAQASSIYNPTDKTYLFLTGYTEPAVQPMATLFKAKSPWGPWKAAATFPAGYIASIVPKGYGKGYIYFTSAGGTVTYNLQIGWIGY
ncbi:MAG: DUF4185 domain-containing protein [Candidatus Dadabacteria bacterium]|nr:MAG: DUF4185 domain-containing protein [Candidatus Dadabacteria bacterium]